MDVTRLLEADHRRIEQLLEDVADANGTDRTTLVRELARVLKGHMELEESVVYPAMEPVTGADAVKAGIDEHRLARRVVDELVRLTPDKPGLERCLDALHTAVEHHVEDEERDLFPELRFEVALLDQLARPFAAMRADLGLPTTVG